MAKQTVINFLKTCINMYIVLLDPVLSNPKTGPNEAGTTWHVCFVRWNQSGSLEIFKPIPQQIL